MKKELEEYSYDYKRLKKKYPEINKFYYNYIDGDYLNTAYTEYFDDKGTKLEQENHGYYG